MRLIGTHSLELEEFFDIHVPTYAILSHTWADGEVSLQDWADRKNRRFKPGFGKIVAACAEAARDGIAYIWVDTNCIDKTSSAELSEAINSMFKWYQRSVVCYAHLDDVPHASVEDCGADGSPFRRARWFTRGWTLQELIAPPVVRFFSSDWREIGAKADMTMALTISDVTGISAWCLRRGMFSKLSPLRGYSVAQRLSWASGRSTTRVEDQAYCLLGLFDISMPLVYGEGSDAFARLLEEIMRKYTDHSVLASQLRYVDFLPRSPKEFCNSQFVATGRSTHVSKHYTPTLHSHPFHMTNSGLRMTLPIVTTLAPLFAFGVLDCWDASSGTTRTTRSLSRIWIPLLRKGSDRVCQFTRLLWPSPFLAVRLVAGEEFHAAGESDGGTTVGHGVTSVSPVDLVPSDMHQDILIQKPYAAILSVPKWTPREAASPFLLCFPRGASENRLFGVFPQSNASDNELREQLSSGLPLVQSRSLKQMVGSESLASTASDDAWADGDVYGSVVVFKKQRSSPPLFVAVCLAHVSRTKEDGTVADEPGCKVVSDWTPASLNAALVLRDLKQTDSDGDVLVTVQKTLCASHTSSSRGMEHRFVGLAQVVFDRRELLAEQAERSALNNSAMPSMLALMGKACSDDE